VFLAAVAAASGALGWQVWEVVRPHRAPDGPANLGLELARAQAVRFDASDGVAIGAWYLEGDPGAPAIILAPDDGQGKAALLDLAIVLQGAGFHALVLDLRAHGSSAGRVATLGIAEKRDVLGAVDWLQRRPEVGHGRIGAFGVGAGAQAVVLAAADRRNLGALVLDGLYPDAAWALEERVFEGWAFGRDRLGFLARAWFRVLTGADSREPSASAALAALDGKDVLLIAPAGDPRLAAWAKTTYEDLPQTRRSEGNLVFREATMATGLRGAARSELHAFVESFFSTRLRAG
jgi:alpha-beta hydrolase superfamily lysophospholipase